MSDNNNGARPSDQALVQASNPQAVSTKGFDPSREEDHPVLRAILDVRHAAAHDSIAEQWPMMKFSHYDQATMACYHAVRAVLAQVIEARSDETPKSGSAEGESPVDNADAPRKDQS